MTSEDIINKIFFLGRFKEELYNNVMQYKMTLSDYVYYERQAFTPNNINNILYDYNFREKKRNLEFLISENEKTIEKIDQTLNFICTHEWTTDEIELPMDRGLETICYCKVCNIKKKE